MDNNTFTKVINEHKERRVAKISLTMADGKEATLDIEAGTTLGSSGALVMVESSDSILVVGKGSQKFQAMLVLHLLGELDTNILEVIIDKILGDYYEELETETETESEGGYH